MEEEQFEGEEPPLVEDFDQDVCRDIKITKQIFGQVFIEGVEREVIGFSLENKSKDAIQVRVSSLGAAIVAIMAPDRKGIYKDVVAGFDDVEDYMGFNNPGFGKIYNLCHLPINLEKTLWEWDFDRNEGSVTFSKMILSIGLLINVKYTLTSENEIVVDLRTSSTKIYPISLTSQVYWNMKGHDSGEESMKHHVLTLNSDKIWFYYNCNLKNIVSIAGHSYDFRIPTLMDSPKIFGASNFEKVYVVKKGREQKLAFLGRLLHPRTCRYVEVFSDHPWMRCCTLNELPRQVPDYPVQEGEEEYLHSQISNLEKYSTDKLLKMLRSCSGLNRERLGLENMNSLRSSLTELTGKDGSCYKKYGLFTITPLSDLSGLDPVVSPSHDYTHKIIYKLGVYRKFCRPEKEHVEEIICEEQTEGFVDIEQE